MARKPISPEDRKRGIALAERVQKLREQKLFTQTQLSAVSGVNIDTLRAIEGKKVPQPGIFTLSDIAEALGIEIQDLIPKRNERNQIKKSTDKGNKR